MITAAVRPVLAKIEALKRDATGATAIEYALIAALIAVVCIGAFTSLGNSNNGGWSSMANKVVTAMQK